MIQTQYFALIGGLDLTTPAIQVPPGRAIAGVNYEPHPAGYQRVDGYERRDGRPRPSKASYWVIQFDAGQAAIAEDDTVTGATSGASGRAVIDAVVESGSYGGSDAAGYVVLTNVSGTFQDNENLQVSAATKVVADGVAVERGAGNDTDDATWIQSAIEKARADIDALPGSGPVRGAWAYGSDIYAFRDNSGGTAGVMHKATASGWSAVDLGREIAFDAGTAEFFEAETLTGGTSGATATIKRVVKESGGWSGSDAAGRLILASVTGTFQDNETITSASGSATSDGADAAITLPAGGRYDFRNHNFYGASDLFRMYGCNGEGRGFEFDGTVFVPIDTGMVEDKPIRVEVHRNHLFFGFRGGSLQHSSTGEPYVWSPITGAGEIGIGEDISDLLGSVAGALIVFGDNKVATLVGDDSANWVLNILAEDAGAAAWTGQMIGTPIYLDRLGVRSATTTDRFGNFLLGTLTQLVEPLFRAKRAAGVTPIGAIRVRAKDQYRLYWSDGTGMTIYFGREPAEILLFKLDFVPTCLYSAQTDTDGAEVLLAGDADGMVYEFDAGTSFDGEPVPAFLRLAFNHLGSPSQKQRFTKATVEMDGGPSTTLGLTAEFSYGDPDQPPSIEQTFDVAGGGGFWDEMIWDQFYWSSPVEGQAEAPLDGIGRNVSLTLISNATYEQPHVLSGVIFNFSNRGIVR
ncbi:MAG: hypothetical protein RJQ08_13665 [Salinisphaeraceae bacterium]